MTNNIGNGSIPLRIGNLIHTNVYGGPFRVCPDYMFSVKMAEEINAECSVSVPTEDFNVPEISDLRKGVVKALMAMINDQPVYAGCMGGIGRTGIFLAALAKVQVEYRKSKHRAGRGDDPVLYVRKHFIPHAVETQQQKDFINDFDVSSIVTWLDATQTAMGMGGFTPSNSIVDNKFTCTSCTEQCDVKDSVEFPQGLVCPNCAREITKAVDEMENPCASTYDPDTLECTEPNTLVYDEHETIPFNSFEGNVQLKYARHRAQWKELRQAANEQRSDQYQEVDKFDDTDSGCSDNLQTQIWKLEERLEASETRVDKNMVAVANNVDMRFSAVRALFKEEILSLTKQTWYERIQDKIERFQKFMRMSGAEK